MTLFGFLLASAYIPGVTGTAVHTGWLFLSATLPWILRDRLLYLLRMPFLWFAILGLAWTPIFAQGIYDLWRLCCLAAGFALGATRTNTSGLLKGLAVGVGFTTLIWAYVNPNILGEIAALVTVGLVAYELWWWLPLTLPGLALSNSRSALLAVAVVGALACYRRWGILGVLIVGFLASEGAIIATFHGNKADHGYSGNIWGRVAIWENTIDGFTWLGRGPGSFIITYPVFASRTDTATSREEDAHNDYLQLIYQYGLGTILLFPILFWGLLGPLVPERYVFIAFSVICAFNFPLALPATGFLGAFVLGRLWDGRIVFDASMFSCNRPNGGWADVS